MVSSRNIVPRNNIIPGAKDDTFKMDRSVPPAKLDPKVASVTITASQMAQISQHPVTLVSPSSPGCVVVVVKVVATKDEGAYGSPHALAIRYGESGPEWGRVAVAVFRDVAAQTDVASPSKPTWDTPLPPSAPLVVNAGGGYTGNGGDVELVVTYFEVLPE